MISCLSFSRVLARWWSQKMHMAVLFYSSGCLENQWTRLWISIRSIPYAAKLPVINEGLIFHFLVITLVLTTFSQMRLEKNTWFLHFGFHFTSSCFLFSWQVHGWMWNGTQPPMARRNSACSLTNCPRLLCPSLGIISWAKSFV